MIPPKVRQVLHEVIVDFRWHQLFMICGLMILSLLAIYSATSHGSDELPAQVKGQLKWFGVGLGLYLFVALTDYHWFCRRSWLLYLLVFIALVYVLEHGERRFGAVRWIKWHGITVQPSEFAKLTVLLVLCHYLGRTMGSLGDWRRLGFSLALSLVPAALIHKEPDLGTALVVVAMGLMLLFLAGAPSRFFIGLGLAVVGIAAVFFFDLYRYNQYLREHSDDAKRGAAVARRDSPAESGHPGISSRFGILHLKTYQLDRILVTMAPDQFNPLDKRWNRDQSLIAIGSGGLYGKGWCKGNVTRGGYLPGTIAHNDFIFAVFAEENGFIGGVALLCFYAALLIGGVRIALKAGDDLGMLLAGGITFLLFFHVIVNIGMTLGVLPIVGVPLPLMSYGGSFVIVCMICLGLLQSVWLHRKPY
jgi:rod shape determining protein RodA